MRRNIARNCFRVMRGLDVRPLMRLSIGQPLSFGTLDRASGALGVVNTKGDAV